MIKTETVTMNNRTLVRTYSDANRMIKQDGTGAVYSEAYDPAGSGRTYTETEESIETDMTETEEKAKAYDIIMGVNE